MQLPTVLINAFRIELWFSSIANTVPLVYTPLHSFGPQQQGLTFCGYLGGRRIRRAGDAALKRHAARHEATARHSLMLERWLWVVMPRAVLSLAGMLMFDRTLHHWAETVIGHGVAACSLQVIVSMTMACSLTAARVTPSTSPKPLPPE